MNDRAAARGAVLYWMSRDKRIRDNWALLYAAELARESGPLCVAFCLDGEFPGPSLRQYAFMLKGLAETERGLRAAGIPFYLLRGDPAEAIPAFAAKNKLGVVVTDFNPLRDKRELKNTVAFKLTIPLYEVDAHNIVPCFMASRKQEYGAYTIRPKIRKLLPEFLAGFPALKLKSANPAPLPAPVDWEKTLKSLKCDSPVPEAGWIKPGENAGLKALRGFVDNRLSAYDSARNDPNLNGQSGLSPYLRFGQLSAQRVALEVARASAPKAAREALLEELIVRRELSDNFCYYNPRYDSVGGFPAWARRTLDEHRTDKREYIYSTDQFEQALTLDPLWNAAQSEMAATGKMHGYMRMYWAKKILEWSASPEEAMSAAIYLNDKYELDGRDPNGYAGVAWSIGGVHDRAWGERPVFGKIRYMNFNGCKSKFNVAEYIAKHKPQ
ncbi:MAG: deoxyribodipyrimidine photo-lyase [bacterium]